MITQIFNQGKNEIKIQMPESLEDAKKNGFKEGQPHKIFINGKSTDNYMGMIMFMVEEAKKNNQQFTSDKMNIVAERKKLFDNQKKAMKEQLDKIKTEYAKLGICSEEMNSVFEEFESKINIEGIRTTE